MADENKIPQTSSELKLLEEFREELRKLCEQDKYDDISFNYVATHDKVDDGVLWGGNACFVCSIQRGMQIIITRGLRHTSADKQAAEDQLREMVIGSILFDENETKH